MGDFQEDNDASASADTSHTETSTEKTIETVNNDASQERKPAGWVDFRNAAPEEVEAKFNDLYGQTKQSKRAAQEAKQTVEQYKRIADEQSRLINELTNSQHSIVNHLEKQSYAEAENAIMQKAQAAFESGDTQAFLRANRELAQIEAQKIIQAQQKPQQVKPQQQTNRYPDAGQMAQQAVADSDLSPQEATVIESWRDERDDSGRELRPWAINKGTNERPDPNYARAFFTAQSVFENPQYENLSIQQKLAKVDELMGVKKSTPSQAVMGGGLTNKRASSKINISPEIEKMAVRLKFGGSKAKSDSDHIQAYMRQIEETRNRNKGARK